eukprot:1189949-Prorocentrum_minimum.AAC.2
MDFRGAWCGLDATGCNVDVKGAYLVVEVLHLVSLAAVRKQRQCLRRRRTARHPLSIRRSAQQRSPYRPQRSPYHPQCSGGGVTTYVTPARRSQEGRALLGWAILVVVSSRFFLRVV